MRWIAFVLGKFQHQQRCLRQRSTRRPFYRRCSRSRRDDGCSRRRVCRHTTRLTRAGSSCFRRLRCSSAEWMFSAWCFHRVLPGRRIVSHRGSQRLLLREQRSLRLWIESREHSGGGRTLLLYGGVVSVSWTGRSTLLRTALQSVHHNYDWFGSTVRQCAVPLRGAGRSSVECCSSEINVQRSSVLHANPTAIHRNDGGRSILRRHDCSRTLCAR